jgi:hypothetical protein
MPTYRRSTILSITIEPGVNEFEAIIIMEELKKRNVSWATMRPGNNCVWVSYNQLETYWIFREGRLVDIQID